MRARGGLVSRRLNMLDDLEAVRSVSVDILPSNQQNHDEVLRT
jgi:hypothetical protein